MAFYHRKLWEQKPRQWGPMSAVQVALRRNLECIGIDFSDIVLAMPMWCQGSQTNYSNGQRLVPAANDYQFKNDGIEFGGDIASGFAPTSGNICEFTVDDEFTYIFDLLAGVPAESMFAGRYDSLDDAIWAKQDTGMRFKELYFSDVTDFSIRRKYTFTSNGRGLLGSDLKYYINGNYASEYTEKSTNHTLNSIGSGYSNINNYALDGVLYQFLIFSCKLNQDQIFKLSDNPYYLWQQPTFRTYFIPSGDIPIYTPINRVFNGPFSGPFTGAL